MPKKETVSEYPSSDHKKICKSVHQYSKGKIGREDMNILMEIGHGCMVARNYIYQRYGGVRSIGKVHSGYTVEMEVRESGFREKIGLPSVYFTAAVNRALGDIRTMWVQVKSGINDAASRNERFSPEDRHYIRFVLKVNGCLDSILNGRPVTLPEAMKAGYEGVIAELGDGSVQNAARIAQRVENLNRYICRQVRKRLHRQHTENTEYFTIKKQGYRYGESDGEHGIFLATKSSGKRLFIALTDANVYDRMLDIKLNPQEGKAEIVIPLFVNIRQHEDYTNEIGISLGLWNMATTSTGNVYGSEFGKMQQEISDFILKENYQDGSPSAVKDPEDKTLHVHAAGRENVSATKRYRIQKSKLDAALKNYVNMEINRMLEKEKPKVVYMAKLPRNPGIHIRQHAALQQGNSTGNTYFLKMWKKGFVTERIQWKCQENGIRIIEVLGKGVGTECAACGQTGYVKGETFYCSSCGYEENRKINGAKNALNRGKAGKQLNKQFPRTK